MQVLPSPAYLVINLFGALGIAHHADEPIPVLGDVTAGVGLEAKAKFGLIKCWRLTATVMFQLTFTMLYLLLNSSMTNRPVTHFELQFCRITFSTLKCPSVVQIFLLPHLCYCQVLRHAKLGTPFRCAGVHVEWPVFVQIPLDSVIILVEFVQNLATLSPG